MVRIVEGDLDGDSEDGSCDDGNGEDGDNDGAKDGTQTNFTNPY